MTTLEAKPSVGQDQLDRMMPVLLANQKLEAGPAHLVRTNHASKLGHACERYLYYMRHDSDKQKPWDNPGRGILGNIIADWWKYHMRAKGFKITHDQLPLRDEIAKKYQIGGKIDGRIGWAEVRPLLYELKTMDQRYFDKINTYEDFFNSKADWIKMYPAQLQTYLFSENEEAGLFVLVNDWSLEYKFIPVHLDFNYIEWLLQRAERVNKANVAGTPPARIPYGKTCQRCDFALTCLPDIKNEGLDFVDQDNLHLLVKEREALEAAADRFDKVDKEAKAIAKAAGKTFILNSEYKVEIKEIDTSRVDTKAMTSAEKEKYTVRSKQVRNDFIPLREA